MSLIGQKVKLGVWFTVLDRGHNSLLLKGGLGGLEQVWQDERWVQDEAMEWTERPIERGDWFTVNNRPGIAYQCEEVVGNSLLAACPVVLREDCKLLRIKE